MQIGARIQAAAELLDAVERRPMDDGAPPADAILNVYFRSRRYIGAKDRRAIGDAVYQTLRQRGLIDWWLRDFAGLPVENVFRAMWTFNIHQGIDPEEIIRACDGARHAPAALTEDQARRVKLLTLGVTEAPDALADRASFSAALTSEIERQFGEEAWAEMIAFTQPAPTDLRVNTLKADREEALSALAASGVAAEATALSPLGLRLAGRANLVNLRAYREGWIEVQDESSQLAAIMTDARPGMRVLDYCAGAGGKSLALAAAMTNRGRIVACDVSGDRLARMKPRLARSGARIIESRRIDPKRGGDDLGLFDRVLVDTPCSGSGTWRRRPETKWRLTPEALRTTQARQMAVLSAAAAHVKPGGRLVYAVCSILPSEGRDVVEGFVAKEVSFRLLSAGEIWRATLGTDAPFAGDFMLLTPHRHNTDGFFLAVLERRQ